MKAKWLIRLAVVVALSALAGACRESSKEPEAAPPKTFNDSTGEAPAPGDLKTVTVSHDALGVLKFRLDSAANLRHGSVVAYFDSDRNPRTGAKARLGADYILVLSGRTREHNQYTFGHWSGTRFVQTFWTSTSRQPMFEVDSYQLDGTNGFNFTVATTRGSRTRNVNPGQVDFEQGAPVEVDPHVLDRAPDPGHAPWRYDIKLERVRASVVSFATRPKSPKAGQPIYATTTVETTAPGASHQGAHQLRLVPRNSRREAGRGAVRDGLPRR